ncbi:rab3 GTPase-activating protein catalytic subunit [Senna tora]|uniref:Rab3 GTPase-activating protein catalytic subunit n=1 Tax=Senna tora TaxID=362788 RepID=A0A834WA16_9FABA|nr:rab3 GTPase-activating protein catalytic subunit [Senna tora]
MVALSFVSKAKSAFHSAAAKAERVIEDFKSERGSACCYMPFFFFDLVISISVYLLTQWLIGGEGADKESPDNLSRQPEDESPQSEWESKVMAIGMIMVLRLRIKKIRTGRKDKTINVGFRSSSSGESSPVQEKLSAVKALVLNEKEGKLTSEFSKDEKVLYLINSLLYPEGEFLRRKINYGSEETDISSLPRDIHGAPPESLIVKLAEVIGNFKNLRKMALFWCRVVVELRKFWSEEQHLPGVPMYEIPDLRSCLLYQQFQVINCCISRKRHRIIATESLDSMMLKASSNLDESADYSGRITSNPVPYAKLSSGELVVRLGADCPSGNLALLETGEPMYSPVTQEGPLLTEDLIKETEEFVLQTGSVGAACSQLLSDMQAFKAANPGCIMEDFVRWYSPPDWIESESSTEAQESLDGSESLSTKGQLSLRMQKEGNLWRELWDTAKPVPAVKQAPLFDEDLAAEGILNGFENIQPCQLFEQLFISLLGLGFAIAEPMLSGNKDFSKLFYDCKEYILVTCQGDNWSEKVDDLCQVYESVETMLLNPEEALKMMRQTEEPTLTTGELKHRFKRLSLIFSAKDKLLTKPISKFKISNEENTIRQSFSSFLDSKSSLFSKKSKPESTVNTTKNPPCVENDWTLV